MVVVEFAYEDMKRLVDLPRNEMVAALSELGAPAEYEKEVDKIIAELTPNRPDWYSMEGLARALKAYCGKGHPTYKTRKSKYTVIVDPSVAEIRPFTVCAVVKGLKFDDRRIRDMVLLQEKLLATLGRKVKKFGLGLYPLQTIKFPIRYTTMEPEEIKYVPLGYDEVMSANEILERHKKGQQYGYLIKEHPRYPVFVDAEGKVMALVPIVNSAETGKVDENTKEVFIEVTGNDINGCKAALNILVCTFADMGGKIFEVEMQYGGKRFFSPDLKPKTVELDVAKVNKILGVELDAKTIGRLLERMGYGYKKNIVFVPPYRADVIGLVDIVEDIAIAYGYNNFKPTLPNFFSPAEVIRTDDALDEIMCGMGFIEIKTFILTNKEKLEIIGAEQGVVEITNPNTIEYTVVRPSLVADMLETFAINKMKELPQKFYEIGIVHSEGKTRKKLVFGIMDKKLEFSHVRGYLQTIASEMGFNFTFEKKQLKVFEQDMSCVIIVNGKEIGIFGKINKNVLEKFGLGFDTYICEFNV